MTTPRLPTSQDPDIEKATIRICSRCIYDERLLGIEFDRDGICSYCHQVDALIEQYGTGQPRGEATFERFVDEMKRAGHGKRYDCLIGVSGGTDSSYLVHLAKSLGLRPLAVHYDNTWNSAIATMNIHKVLKALDVDLYTHVVDNEEMDDIFRSFFRAGVAEIDASTDLGFAYLLRLVAARYGIEHILEGHTFIAEGITPLGRNYFDGRYIRSIHRRFGKRAMRTYPLMTMARFLRSATLTRVKFIRPLWYVPYSKENAQLLLAREYGWQYYGGHHLENRMTAFFHSVYLPQKFNNDMRSNTLSAQVRLGHLTRAEAWATYNTPPFIEPEIISYVKKRLKLTDHEYDEIMASEPKSWTDYPTYKKDFERLGPLFLFLAKRNRVPMSFYLKYCRPSPAPA